MNAPAVAVIIPTYNRSDALSRLLRALADCARPAGGFEIVIVDDGSTDDTACRVRAAPIAVRYVRQDNRGPAAARNQGWRATSAGIVAFTDDDTVPTSAWLVDIVGAFERQPDLAGVGGRIEPLVRGFVADFVQAERLVGHGVDERGVRYLVTANAAYRRQALEDVGGFDESFPAAAGEDVDLSFRIVASGRRLGVVDGAAVHHDHRTSLVALGRTYRRHGQARALLERRHPALRGGVAVGVGLSVAYWRRRFGLYRRGGASPGVALAYLMIRAVGLVCVRFGMARAPRRP